MAEQDPTLTELNVTSEVAVNVTSNGPRSRPLLENVLGERSSENKTAVLLQISHRLYRRESEINQAPNDELLPRLAKTFFRILTGRELEVGKPVLITKNDHDDHFTAQDLIEQMISDCEDFNIEDVPQHPFFWSKRKKIDFICESYERFDQRNKHSKHMINDNTDHVIPQNTGWIEELKLSHPELRYLYKNYPDLTFGDETLCSYDNVRERFDKTLIFKLMRYFRNRHTHYWQTSLMIRTAFGDYNEGYWEFFERRFPKLLIHVYRMIENCFGKVDNKQTTADGQMDHDFAITSKILTELGITEKVLTGTTADESLTTTSKATTELSITEKGWKQIEGTNIKYDQANRYRNDSKVFNAIRTSGGEDQKTVVKFVTGLNIEDEEIMKKIQREIDNHWATHTHKNVVKYFDSGRCKHEGQDAIFILMEKCDEKTLSERIKEGNLPYIKRAEIVKCIAQGLQHLREKNILHRDLKPENILYKDDVYVISDFGLSKTVSSNKSYTFQSSKYVGTKGWGAPETYSDNAKSSFDADIYSAGLVFHFALTNGKHPYGDNPISWQIDIIRDKNGENCDLKALHDSPNENVAYDLISLMLSRDPKDRPTIEEVLKHPFFWDVKEKIFFYDDIWSIIEYHSKRKTESRIFSSPSAKYLNEVETKKKNWRDKLLLTNTEKKTIEDNFGRRGFDITVQEDVMKGFTENRFAKNLADSVTSMVCFIRNRFTHSSEDKRDEKIDFSNEELWEFFDSRYPYLFLYTYYASKDYYKTKPASDPDNLKKYFTADLKTPKAVKQTSTSLPEMTIHPKYIKQHCL